MRRSYTDMAESRALVALLAELPDRARSEVGQLTLGERAKCARVARSLADLCEDPTIPPPHGRQS